MVYTKNSNYNTTDKSNACNFIHKKIFVSLAFTLTVPGQVNYSVPCGVKHTTVTSTKTEDIFVLLS